MSTPHEASIEGSRCRFHVLHSLATNISQLAVLDGNWQVIKCVTGSVGQLISMNVHTYIAILLGNKVEKSIGWPQRDLVCAFRYSDVIFFDFQQKSYPDYAHSMTSPMDIMADLFSSINEHVAKGSTQDIANVIDAAVVETFTVCCFLSFHFKREEGYGLKFQCIFLV